MLLAASLLFCIASAAPQEPVVCTLEGTVTMDREVLPGAVVTLRREVEFTTVETTAVKTDEKGHFAFPPVKEDFYRVSTSRPDRVPAAVALRCDAQAVIAPLTLELGVGDVPVRGQVTDKDGAPLHDAEVSVVEVGDRKTAREDKLFKVAHHVDVDAAGGFEFRVPSGRSYILYVQAPGYSFQHLNMNLDPKRPSLVTDVSVASTQVEHAFKLLRQGIITGVVLEGGKPVPGAEVSVGPSGRFSGVPVMTDAQGVFRLPIAPAEQGKGRKQGDSKVVVWARAGNSVAVRKLQVPGEGAVLETSLKMATGGSVSGTVLVDGKPMPFVTVHFRQSQVGVHGRVNADVHGNFSIPGLVPGKEVVVLAAGGKHLETRVMPGATAAVVTVVPEDEDAARK